MDGRLNGNDPQEIGLFGFQELLSLTFATRVIIFIRVVRITRIIRVLT